MGLFRQVSTREVLRCLADGLRLVAPGVPVRISGKSSISCARSRLGTAPFEELRRARVAPLAEFGDRRGCRTVALDGTTLDLPDEERNREAFGLPGAARGEAAFPKARLALLMETGTRAALAWRAGPFRGESEHSQAEALLGHPEPGMLLPADRGQFGFPLRSRASETGAELLRRASRSGMGRGRPNCGVRDWTVGGAAALAGSGSWNVGSRRRFSTPARELAGLYPERWEIENACDEVKTHLLGPGAALRSKTPDLVLREIDGLMLAHCAVRSLIRRAAGKAREDPDGISSAHAVRVARRRLQNPGRRFPLIRTLSRRPSMPRSSRSAPCGAGDRQSREECAEK